MNGSSALLLHTGDPMDHTYGAARCRARLGRATEVADHDRTSNLAEASQNRSFIARFCILIQGVDNLEQAPLHPLQYLDIEPAIHQAERLCGGLPPSVLRVSEKNSSRQSDE